MAVGQPLPDEHHAMRGCARGHDGEEITSEAFAMKPNEKALLRISVDWVECAHAIACEQSVEASVKRCESIPLSKPYVVLPVSGVREIAHAGRSFDVLEADAKSNPCHSHIVGFLNDDSDLLFQSDLAELANRSQIIK